MKYYSDSSCTVAATLNGQHSEFISSDVSLCAIDTFFGFSDENININPRVVCQQNFHNLTSATHSPSLIPTFNPSIAPTPYTFHKYIEIRTFSESTCQPNEMLQNNIVALNTCLYSYGPSSFITRRQLDSVSMSSEETDSLAEFNQLHRHDTNRGRSQHEEDIELLKVTNNVNHWIKYHANISATDPSHVQFFYTKYSDSTCEHATSVTTLLNNQDAVRTSTCHTFPAVSGQYMTVQLINTTTLANSINPQGFSNLAVFT